MTEETKREQTLLEAAKAIDSFFGTASLYACSDLVLNLRAAIARAESETLDFHKTNLPHIDRAWKAEDRAQQAEADAAWHKAESARLSAELAKKGATLSAMTQAVGMLTTLHGSMPIDVDDPIGMARKIVGHVEAELAKAKEVVDSIKPAHPTEVSWVVAQSWRERAEKAESDLADQIVRAARWQTRAEEAEAALAKRQQSHPMDGGEITVLLNRAGVKSTTWPGANGAADLTTPQRVEWLIGEWNRLRGIVDLAKKFWGVS